jgi:hypothetical protein
MHARPCFHSQPNTSAQADKSGDFTQVAQSMATPDEKEQDD